MSSDFEDALSVARQEFSAGTAAAENADMRAERLVDGALGNFRSIGLQARHKLVDAGAAEFALARDDRAQHVTTDAKAVILVDWGVSESSCREGVGLLADGSPIFLDSVYRFATTKTRFRGRTIPATVDGSQVLVGYREFPFWIGDRKSSGSYRKLWVRGYDPDSRTVRQIPATQKAAITIDWNSGAEYVAEYWTQMAETVPQWVVRCTAERLAALEL